MTDLHVEESAVVRGRLGVALTGLHIVRFGGIVSGKDRGNAGQLLRFAHVNGLDIGAGKGAAQDMQAPCILRHLVLHKHGLTGNERHTVDLAAGLAADLKIGTEGRSNLASELAEIAQLTRELHRKVIVLIAGIADEDAGQHVLDLFLGGVGFLLEQPCEDQCGGRSVVGALHDAGGDHGLLHEVDLTPVHQALSSADLRTLRLIEQDEVCILEFAVEDNRITAGKALSIVAVADTAVACTVQYVAESCGGLSAEDDLFTVNSTFQFHRCYLPSVKTMLARYFLYAALPVRSSTKVICSERFGAVP